MQVLLQLRDEEGVLSGSIAADGRETEEFHGWLGLATVLQRLLEERAAQVDGCVR